MSINLAVRLIRQIVLYVHLTKEYDMLELRKHVLEILSTEWTTTDELAEILSVKFPSEIMFERDYKGDKKVLSQALGPTLWALSNDGFVEDDGSVWKKRWRKVEKEERTSVDAVVESLVQLNYAQNENQALRILAIRAIRENPEDYEKLVEEAKKIEETKKRLLKIAIGTEKKAD